MMVASDEHRQAVARAGALEGGGAGDPFSNPCRRAHAPISPPSTMEAAYCSRFASNWMTATEFRCGLFHFRAPIFRAY